MTPVYISVPGTVNIRMLHVVVGAEEILRVKREMALVPLRHIYPERVYRMKLRYSAN